MVENTEPTVRNMTWRDILQDAHNLRIGTIMAGLLMAIASALPYLVMQDDLARFTGVKSVSLLYVAGKAGDGFVFILLAVLVAIFTMFRKKIPVLLCAVASLVWYCREFLRFQKVNGQMLGRTSHLRDYVSKGSGFYLLSVAVIALLLLSILSLRSQNDNRELEQMK